MSPEPFRRTYDQYCGVARALDVLGERWTLLIVRDLLPGPRRFGQLSEQIPGISSDLLTARLRMLQAHGVVERVETGGVGGGVTYSLTDAGQQLRPLIGELATIGLRWLEPPTHAPEHRDLAWALLTASLYVPSADVPAEPVIVAGTHDRFLLRRGHDHIDVSYSDRAVGAVPAPDEIAGDDDTMLAVLSGHLDLAASTLHVHGNRRTPRS